MEYPWVDLDDPNVNVNFLLPWGTILVPEGHRLITLERKLTTVNPFTKKAGKPVESGGRGK